MLDLKRPSECGSPSPLGRDPQCSPQALPGQCFPLPCAHQLVSTRALTLSPFQPHWPSLSSPRGWPLGRPSLSLPLSGSEWMCSVLSEPPPLCLPSCAPIPQVARRCYLIASDGEYLPPCWTVNSTWAGATETWGFARCRLLICFLNE